MGYDAPCTLRLDGRTVNGIALLEHRDLIFRGDVRVVIPLALITSARAADGRLEVTWSGQTAEFSLGAAAARWADRITNPPSRLDKLGVKHGTVVVLVNVDDDLFVEELVRRGARILRRAGAHTADLVFYGAASRESLDRLPALITAMKQAGGIWVLRPKGRREITEADVRAAGRHAGLVDVKVVSFSETQSAEKLVIPVAKRSTPGRPSPSPRKRGSASSRART